MTENTLRARLSRPPIVIAPGVYDPLTALIAEQAGFEALYVSGAAIAYTRLGRPDIGLVSMSEVVETVALIRDRVGAHLVVDADTGYGNALNVERTVRLLERAGANAIQIEDQDFPKRCGHLDDKTLISAPEMVGKIKAALDARRFARHAGDRPHRRGRRRGLRARHRACRAYREAGADMLFVEAPRQRDELAPHRRAAAEVGAADGEHGRGRQDAAAGGERTGSARLRLRHLPRRHRARARQGGGGILRLAQGARHHRSVPRRACSISTRSIDVIGTPELIARGKRYEAAPRRRQETWAT